MRRKSSVLKTYFLLPYVCLIICRGSSERLQLHSFKRQKRQTSERLTKPMWMSRRGGEIMVCLTSAWPGAKSMLERKVHNVNIHSFIDTAKAPRHLVGTMGSTGLHDMNPERPSPPTHKAHSTKGSPDCSVRCHRMASGP